MYELCVVDGMPGMMESMAERIENSILELSKRGAQIINQSMNNCVLLANFVSSAE